MNYLSIEGFKGLPGLKAIRKSLELTQKQASKLAGVSDVFLGFLEKGSQDCSMGVAKKFAFELGCTVDDLLIISPFEDRLAQIKVAFCERSLVRSRFAAAESFVGGAQ